MFSWPPTGGIWMNLGFEGLPICRMLGGFFVKTDFLWLFFFLNSFLQFLFWWKTSAKNTRVKHVIHFKDGRWQKKTLKTNIGRLENPQNEWVDLPCEFQGCYMGVSKNRGTPKSYILIGISIMNHPFWGKHPYFWKHPYTSFLYVFFFFSDQFKKPLSYGKKMS